MKEENVCKHNGVFFQYVEKTWYKDEMQLLLTIIEFFFFF